LIAIKHADTVPAAISNPATEAKMLRGSIFGSYAGYHVYIVVMMAGNSKCDVEGSPYKVGTRAQPCHLAVSPSLAQINAICSRDKDDFIPNQSSRSIACDFSVHYFLAWRNKLFE
jgi:hypothetical protein